MFPSSEEILNLFRTHPEQTFRLRELIQELGLPSSQGRELKSALKDLSRSRKITYGKRGRFALGDRGRADAHGSVRTISYAARSAPAGAFPPRSNVATGRLIGHREGFGFVVPDAPMKAALPDIFIPPQRMKDAMHGDRVEAQIFRARPGFRDGGQMRLEGTILRVLDRAQKTVVGEFHYGARYNSVRPFDRRISQEIIIPRGQEWPEGSKALNRNRQFGGESAGAGKRPPNRTGRDLEGLIVDVEITSFPGATSLPRGRVIEVLGRREEFGVDVEMIIRKYHLPHRFPSEVLEEAEAAPQAVLAPEREGREDFRALPVVTIDGETAKDFDDAVLVERAPGGNYLLQVHIADVAHYVRPGTALDREARLRGTSVYFPDRAVPMLPLELSNGICSLNPRVDRLVMSVLMEIDAAGKIESSRITPGVIRSHERMTYTAVHAVLSGDRESRKRHSALASAFERMEELAKILIRRREARGSIDFDLPEPEIEFDMQGQMTGVTRSERNIAHRIIEEFMLAANKSVARYLEQRDIPALYRIHEKPGPKKVLEFEEIAATFGYSLGIELPAVKRTRVRGRNGGERAAEFDEIAGDLKITSRNYQQLARRIAGKPEERILSYLMLRSLKQARYSEENAGHFALAFPTYTHFTSPIRRYPDLVVHRVLKAALRERGVPAHMRSGQDGRDPISDDAGLAGGMFLTSEELHGLGIETSESERRAADAERELLDWKKVSFMSGRLGDEFEALTISLTRRGFFVELIELFIEGFVPIESFEEPHWVYLESIRALVDRDSQRALHLGDRIKVRLDRVDADSNKLIFSVVGRPARPIRARKLKNV
ncbi:MAG: ribonuclease R family protein [Terriglobia bacterium]